MNHWLTTHWPQLVEDVVGQPPSGVWVQNGQEHVIQQVAPGDLVFIYESKGGQAVLRNRADGTAEIIRRHPGRRGVVALVEVTAAAYEREGSTPEDYADGSRRWWRYHAPTKPVNTVGFVAGEQLARLFGYKENYGWRAIGEGRSGLMRLSPQRYEAVRDLFLASARADEQRRVAGGRVVPRGGPGGEGPAHRALKGRVAANPVGALGEAGLKHQATEWPFPTGDRIDVLLRDRLDRFVAVEVEVDCDHTEMAGPLQCMKYQAMLSYVFGRQLEEVRCILVAHSVDQAVRERCAMHSIEVVEVPRV